MRLYVVNELNRDPPDHPLLAHDKQDLLRNRAILYAGLIK